MSDTATPSGTDDAAGNKAARAETGQSRTRRARIYDAVRRFVEGLRDGEGASASDDQLSPQPSLHLVTKLREATAGLSFMSEADAPVEVWTWSGNTPFSAEALRAQEGIDADAPLETTDVDRFFRNAVKEYDWQDDAEKQQARRFAALRDLLKAELRDVSVLRFGATAIDVYVVGTAPNGTTMGVRTQVVET